MPPTLQEGSNVLRLVRERNKGSGLDSLNDQELADILYEQTGDERLKPVQRSSALSRGVESVGTFAGNLGQSVENLIGGEGASVPARVAGRAANTLVSSTPEMALNMSSAALKGVGRFAGAGASALFSYGRTKGETGSDKAALGSAAGSLLSLAGGIKGAQVGRNLAGPTAGPVKGFLAGSAGSAVGSVPGDALEIATAPGGMAEFLADPINLPAYALGQGVVGAGLDLASQFAEGRATKREAVKNATPEMESLINKQEVEELTRLRTKPVAEKNEIDVARERELSKRLAVKDELKAASLMKRPFNPNEFSTYPETPATLQAQAYLVHKGKKAVMEIPKGSDPNLDIMGLAAFREHVSPTNGNLYLYDETKVQPEIIENAIKTDSLGILLGYGTAAKPKNHSNTAAVLRNKYGVEKVAVVLGDGNETAVLKSLGEMALGTDKVGVEPLDQVIKWRQDNSGLQKLHSLSSEMSDGQDEISFTNHILRNLEGAFQYSKAGLKGPRFQVDENAEISTKGLVKAIKDWSPGALWEHYKSSGIETLLNSNKVKAADFTKWIRENTPEVEVKKLSPNSGLEAANVQAGQHQHWLESNGFELRNEGGSAVLWKGDEQATRYNTTPEAWQHYQMFVELGFNEASDAATGRYGVEPKPLEQMQGAVDILVRVPTFNDEGLSRSEERDYTVGGRTPASRPLFEGPHFGESDKNVLASIRGYEEVLPSGEKVFHVFELQSDWGQQQKKFDPSRAPGARSEDPAHPYRFNNKVADHPLLSHYETLGLKTAIQHARSIGAKYIAISDAETAMMTEGHDRNLGIVGPDGRRLGTDVDNPNLYREIVNAGGNYKGFTLQSPQEKGMRAAYDQRLPAIAEKLTRSRAQRVEFGTHKASLEESEAGEASNAQGLYGSPVFKNAQGKRKTEVTARLYDISNPSPDIRKLFSLYDADAQATFEHTLRLEASKRDGVVTSQQILEKALGGQQTDIDALLNFLDRMKGLRGVIREGSFLSKKLGEFELATHDIKVSKDFTFQVNEAFRLLSHEMSHGAVHDLHRNQPEVYNYMRDLIEEMGQPARRSILAEIKKTLKLSDKFNVDYLSGSQVDMLVDPYRKDRQAYEFVAALAEASAEHHFKSNTQPEWYKYLPDSIIRVLQTLTRTFRKYFGEQYPGVGHMLDASQDHRLKSLVNLFDKHVNDAAATNLRSLLNLQKSSLFDESNFIDTLPQFRENLQSSVSNLRGSEVLHSWAGDQVKAAVGNAKDFYNRFFYTGLFRTRDKPETAPHFWNLHNFRPTLQSELLGHLANTGQTGNLTRQQALERYGKFVAEVTNPFNKRGQRWLDVTSQILEENGNRRQKLLDEHKMVSRADLLTVDEMQSKYGLTEEEANFVENFSRIPEVVAKERLRKYTEIDTYEVARLFYRANKGQSQDGVVDKVTRLTHTASDIGAKRFQRDSYQKFVDEQQKQANPDMELVGKYQADINALNAELDVFKVLFEQAIRDEFAGSIPIKPGPDGFITTSAEVMIRKAAQREQYRVMTKDIGYAPMTRRGRFNLRVYDNGDIGEEFAKEKAFLGFDTKKDVDKYIADNKLTNYEIIDKDELRERAKLFTPSKIKHLRDKAKQDLADLIAQASRSTEDMDPDQRTQLLDFLNTEVGDKFQPLADEYRDVVAVKGDKYKERRYLVPGFDRNDFLPNIFEYLDYNTVAGTKQVTRARGNYLLEDPRIQKDPELLNRMEKEIDYALNNQAEWTLPRKAIFYNYIAASFRHVAQNAVQVPLNGVSQMMADGHGYKSYGYLTKGAALTTKYNMTGSTGDVYIDSLLKQAEKDGVTAQQSIENPVHESIDLQNALDSINAQASGSRVFGKRLNYAGTRLVKGIERFMQSTSAAAESANRKTTFIGSILAQRAKGQTDLRVQYDEAKKFSNYVNFIGDKPNRPGFMIESGGHWSHGPLSVMTALQSFTLNHISQLVSFYRKGFKQGSKADRQAFYTGLAHLLAVGGSMGFVGANTAEALFEEITGLFGKPISLKLAIRSGLVKGLTSLVGDDEKEEYANVADRMADLVLTGFPGLAGVDLSGSVGLGSPLVRYQAGQVTTAEQVSGPLGGILGNVTEALGQLSADPSNPQQWFAAMRTAAPQFLTQFLRVADVMSAGSVIDKNQQPVGDPLGVVGSAAVLAGFTPTQISKQRQFNSEIYKASKRDSEAYELRVRNIAGQLHSGTDELAVRQFNEYLESVGGLQDRASMVESIADQLEEFEGRITRPASLKGSAGRQRLESAFPSVKSHVPTKQSSLLKSLEVALSLGQDDLVYQKLESLPSSILDAVLNDALVQAGLRPEAAGLVQRPSTLERLGPNPDLQLLSPR
jgi:hypothetical protein